MLFNAMATQITRVLRKVDDSQILKKHSDGTTRPYSIPNLTTMLSGVTDPIFVLRRINASGYAHPFIFQARDRQSLQETLKLLGQRCLGNPDQPFGKPNF